MQFDEWIYDYLHACKYKIRVMSQLVGAKWVKTGCFWGASWDTIFSPEPVGAVRLNPLIHRLIHRHLSQLANPNLGHAESATNGVKTGENVMSEKRKQNPSWDTISGILPNDPSTGSCSD